MEKSYAAIFRSQKAACLFPETSETIDVMTKTDAVSPHELADFLEECSGWDQKGSKISRTFEFQTFLEAIDFVQAVAGVAEEAGHHPDISVHYNKVTLSLMTHSKGCLTTADFEVARRLNELVS